VCVLSAVQRATELRIYGVICLMKGAFVGENNFDVIKMHGTTIKIRFHMVFKIDMCCFPKSHYLDLLYNREPPCLLWYRN
jgi:hypothetical protein